MPSPDAEFLALQQVLAGQYSLERELGRGGMGIVYLAREVSLDRLVAIKVLPPALAARADLRGRFLREARTAAKLSHPHIVPIHRVGEAGPYVYFAMAYVDGETVGQRLRTRGPFPSGEASRILREASWALAYAHAQGVVHRDVKPDNIMLERGSGRALLTDFGIAHVAEATAITDEQVVMGTAHFMSPEQAAGEPLDGRSDLYALGVVGYLMLTGRLPYDAPTVPAVLAKHLAEPVPSLASAGAAPVPALLARTVERCMAKRPADRWASGEALVEALAAAQEERRQLPAALRVWLQKRDPLLPAYLLWSGAHLIAAYGSALNYLSDAGSASSLDRIPRFLALATLPVLPIAVFHAQHAWRALRAGYSRGDLIAALRQQADQEREEHVYVTPNVSLRVARLLQLLTYGSWVGVVVFISALPFLPRELTMAINRSAWWSPWVVLGVPALLTTTGSILGVTFPGRRLKPGRVAELRQRFWESRVGQWTARLLGEGRSAAPDQLIAQPTEVAIGSAAAQLFAALPRELRGRLGDLPGVVRQLEAHARTIRARLQQLDALIVDARTPQQPSQTLAATDTGAALEARRDAVGEQLREARDLAAQRLETTVAALETIRLDLLRLQAGVGDTTRLTTMFDLARELDEDVRRLADANASLDSRALPRAVRAPTPTPTG